MHAIESVLSSAALESSSFIVPAINVPATFSWPSCAVGSSTFRRCSGGVSQASTSDFVPVGLGEHSRAGIVNSSDRGVACGACTCDVRSDVDPGLWAEVQS